MTTTDQQLEIQEIIAKLPPGQLNGVLEFLREMYRVAQETGGESDFDWGRVGRIMHDNDDVLRRLAQ